MLEDGSILYTGMGGCVQGKQVADQVLEKGNASLVLSETLKLPVRLLVKVTFDKKDASEYPKEWRSRGYYYEYRGLYLVKSYKFEKGKSGFKVFRFYMVPLETAEKEGWAPKNARTNHKGEAVTEETAEDEKEQDETPTDAEKTTEAP